MALPLPNLDDRRWADLVEEGRALIPVYGPGWTDHNLHDPGITLLELFAWVAEMDIYGVNRIPAAHRRKFMALAGITPEPPAAARTVLASTLAPGEPPLTLPAGLELSAVDPLGVPTPFRTVGSVTVVGGGLTALLQGNAAGLRDFSGPWRAGEALAVFGETAELGAELYLGFAQPLPPDVPVSLFLGFTGPGTGEEERARILEEERARGLACRHDSPRCGPAAAPPPGDAAAPEAMPPHHGVRLAWEALVAAAGGPRWIGLDPGRGELLDDTRALTLDGIVRLRLPRALARARLSPLPQELYWLRVRLEAGVHDAPPRLRRAVLDAVRAEQAAAASSVIWTLVADAVVGGPAPAPGAVVGVQPRFDGQGRVAALRFVASGAAVPGWLVVGFAPPGAGIAGSLLLEALELGTGSGRPGQVLMIRGAPVQQASLEVWALEAAVWRRWEERPDLDASGRADRHFQLDATRGSLTFGDGEKGLAPPAGARFLARCRLTRAEAGNLAAGSAFELVDSAHNRALLPALDAARAALASAASVDGATGGAAAESLDHASDRAADAASSSPRAVTLADYEALALSTPGTRVARARALGGLHPSFPCFRATGMVTVIVVPDLPGARPAPSPGLLAVVRAALARRRPLGTRVEVVGPGYVEVAVRAALQSAPGVDRAKLRQRAAWRIDAFLDPRRGGPEGTGWPFGREVARAELMQVLNQVPGVAHVQSFDFLVNGCDCDPQCGNVCLRPTELVAAGAHQIQVS